MCTGCLQGTEGGKIAVRMEYMGEEQKKEKEAEMKQEV